MQTTNFKIIIQSVMVLLSVRPPIHHTYQRVRLKVVIWGCVETIRTSVVGLSRVFGSLVGCEYFGVKPRGGENQHSRDLLGVILLIIFLFRISIFRLRLWKLPPICEYITQGYRNTLFFFVACWVLFLLLQVWLLNKLVLELGSTPGITRKMAQKMTVERFEAQEKELAILKELVVTTYRNVERISNDLRELSDRVSKGQSMLTEASQTKNKEVDMEEGESSQEKNGWIDRGKYKNLEMPIFYGEGPDSWHF